MLLEKIILKKKKNKVNLRQDLDYQSEAEVHDKMRRKRRIWRISKGRQLKCFRTLDRKCFQNVKTSLNSLLRNPSQA